MQVAKWGNSLAVRLPRSHIEALGLREGDEVEIPPEAIRKVASNEDARRAAFLCRLDELSRPGPPDFKFDRDEIYDQRLNRIKLDDDAA